METITILEPEKCSVQQIEAFISFVKKGGNVTVANLQDRIMNASVLAFLHLDEQLIGVKALKQPCFSYRQKVFQMANVEQEAVKYPTELGWAFIDKPYRNQGFNSKLTAALRVSAYWKPTFATTTKDNDAVQNSLTNQGFTKIGIPWASTIQQEKQLVLFVSDH